MTARLRRRGDKYSIEVSKQIVDELALDHDSPLEVVSDGRSIIWALDHDSPLEVVSDIVSQPGRRSEFRQALDETNERYGGMLKRLAR